MPQTSIKLFTAWAAKHKEVVALEDRLAALEREGGADAAALQNELADTRSLAERMLQEALASFHGELQARGLGADGGSLR